MTPKEKAESLVEESYQILIDTLEVNTAFYYCKRMTHKICDEMLAIHGSPLHQDYWKSVKMEIEKP